jgi:hypothetical protein
MSFRLLAVLGATFIVLAHFSDAVGLPSAGSPICATATVVEPLGLITGPLINEPMPFGVDPASGAPRFLLVSRSRGVTIDLDGVPIDLAKVSGARTGLVSVLDVRGLAIGQSADHPVTLTIIYSEN